MATNLQFTTHISGEGARGTEVRGVPLEQLINEADFVSTVFLSITGKRPDASQVKLLNALLVACIDHGLQPASGFVPRVSAASGNPVLPAMASCLLALGPQHGGAIGGAMRLFAKLQQDEDIERAALAHIKESRQAGKRLPGFGHPVYREVDPRSAQLFGLARELGLSDQYMNIARTVQTHLEAELARPLVINIDGALAALLLTLDFDPEIGDGIFGLARVAGSIAHIAEEYQQHNSVRRLDSAAIVYAHKKTV